MNRCSCGKSGCTYPECDDGPLPVPVWNQVHTAAGLIEELGKMEHRLAAIVRDFTERLAAVEKIIEQRTADS